MCGIAGFFGFEDKKLLKKMCDVIDYRGPNDFGMFSDKNVGLGIRRLSIIDMKGGKQPIHNENQDIWIVFNGEIYNFPELKTLIESKGHRFYTKSDTECIIHLYEIFGENCVNYLRGMFAFAIWDSRKQALFLARDRLGKKPLYYTVLGDKILFGSEIKSILQSIEIKREVNLQALHEFLTVQYVPGPKTMFKNIWKLEPGHTLTVKKEYIKNKKYWGIKISEKLIDENFCKQMCLKLLEESVKLRMMSEVPLGVYLSGGIDSSAVTAFMARFSDEPINTFTAGFGTKTDEFEYANIIANKFGTNHREIFVDQENINILPEIIWHFDEPIADPAALPTYLMSRKTKKYATVILVGEGGDETFAGYEKYQIMMNIYKNKASKLLFNRKTLSAVAFGLNILTKNKKTQFLSEFSKAIKNPPEAFSRLSALGFTGSEKQDLYSPNLKKIKYKKLQIENFQPSKNIFQNMLEYDMNFWLPDRLLMKVDKMTMAASIEARAPFMDHRLVEFSNQLSPKLRLNKYILKKSLIGILPKEILKRKKHGFAVPISQWFEEGLCKEVERVAELSSMREYFEPKNIKKIIENYRRVRNDHKLWNILNFALWHRIYIEGDSNTLLHRLTDKNIFGL